MRDAASPFRQRAHQRGASTVMTRADDTTLSGGAI